jgi:hypothetical protein
MSLMMIPGRDRNMLDWFTGIIIMYNNNNNNNNNNAFVG